MLAAHEGHFANAMWLAILDLSFVLGPAQVVRGVVVDGGHSMELTISEVALDASDGDWHVFDDVADCLVGDLKVIHGERAESMELAVFPSALVAGQSVGVGHGTKPVALIVLELALIKALAIWEKFRSVSMLADLTRIDLICQRISDRHCRKLACLGVLQGD